MARDLASFATQTNALFRKNLIFQKRNWKSNACVTVFPALLCILLAITQHYIDKSLKADDAEEDKYFVPVLNPAAWPPLMQLPWQATCGGGKSCSAAVLFTGSSQPFAEALVGNFFTNGSYANSSDFLSGLSDFVLGTEVIPSSDLSDDYAFLSGDSVYAILPQCLPGFSLNVSVPIGNKTAQQTVNCLNGLPLWRGSSSKMNDDLFKGYLGASKETLSAYDFLDSGYKIFNAMVFYNSTLGRGFGGPSLLRVPRAVNMVSRAYLQLLKGNDVKLQFEYVKEMPTTVPEHTRLDLSSEFGTLFFLWIVELPLPIILTYLVYEKRQKLRLMMKMHGLGDGPYWTISYAYFLLLSSVYMLFFVIFGSVLGLKFFRLNDYSIQFVFYFIYINLQILLAFLMATAFSSVKTATVIGYIYVFSFGLLGGFLFRFFIEDTSFPRGWVIIMEIVPGFSLFRGMYELSEYSVLGIKTGTSGMQWTDLKDSENGMKEVLIIMALEWLISLPLVYYLDQLASLGTGDRNATMFSLPCFKSKLSTSSMKSNLPEHVANDLLEIGNPDVSQERKVVEQLLQEPNSNYAVISDNLKKVYPGRDGNPENVAVHGLSLALSRGECFGMLGPNGAGKTSFISMMIGLTKPTSGTAFVQGMDIRTHMNEIYTGIGVCPQDDLLWETLTGKEHLMFYGRLKNLKGAALIAAVEESLKSVNLFHGGIGDKRTGKYSGGMKRKLSVAISMIGNPQVVYMDEPSTGLDPASRNFLWNVVKRAKQNRAIILTTHSMEEAEVLCDRLGIFVDGSLQCIGTATDLKARYGGSLVLTMTTPASEEGEVENFVRRLSPRARKIYHISGTQKFELPKEEVRIADVFRAVEEARRKFSVQAWGLTDTTLEDVFIKVAKVTTQSSNDL